MRLELHESLGSRHRLAIRASIARLVPSGHRVVGVGGGDDLALDRNRRPGQADRIAAPVRTLVMMEDPVGDLSELGMWTRISAPTPSAVAVPIPRRLAAADRERLCTRSCRVVKDAAHGEPGARGGRPILRATSLRDLGDGQWTGV